LAEFPEAELVRRFFLVRQMDLPPNVKMTKRSMLRWFALASGLISEKESRSTILEVLDALFHYNFSKKTAPTTVEIHSYLKEKAGKSVSEKLLRYHLKRLLEMHLIVRKRTRYSFNSAPNAEKEDIKAAFLHWFAKPLQESNETLAEVLEGLAKAYK
jgi:predicted transcriptional regulator